MNSARQPLGDMWVELLNEFNVNVGQRQKTNSSGRYYFQSIPQGTYKVRVLATNTQYEEETQEVTIRNFVRQTPGGSVVSGFESIQLDFTLRPRRPRGGAAGNSPAGTVFAQVVPDEARRAYESAVGELGRAKEDAGIAGLKKALALFPQYYLALDRLGTEYVKRQRYGDALPVLTKAVEVNPRGYSSLYALGITQHYLKQPRAAVEAFSRAANVNPASVNAQIWLAIALRGDGHLAEAEAALKRADKLGNGQVGETHWRLAHLYNQQKRYAEAANELELFLKLTPDARDAEQIRKLIKNLRDKARTAGPVRQ